MTFLRLLTLLRQGVKMTPPGGSRGYWNVGGSSVNATMTSILSLSFPLLTPAGWFLK